MRKFGLIGYPLGHSFSQKYFTGKFRNENIPDCSYENFPLKDINRLNELLKLETDLAGLNVTIPHKSDVIRFLDDISPEAEEVGAVNVIKITRDKKEIILSGFNSDVYGFTQSILPFLKKHTGNALVLGTGGSSRAVCYALAKIGLDVTLVSRKHQPGMITYSDVDDLVMKNTSLIVNTTPLGMFPDTTGKPEIDYNLLTSRHILFDLVYNPEMTAFLKEGQERGCTVIGGLKMLHLQAEKSWEIWNDDNL
jgi:shikimate dehydrogenase